ncbi:hypothetical protein KIV35_23695, partial [Enterobacter roggenkampii]|uniref:hypothetical protein n=1 Tax=Enterobacter roggenkampii TaxID=1812935 RepID=UPI001BCD0023
SQSWRIHYPCAKAIGAASNGQSSLRPLMAGSSPSLPDGSNPSAAIVQSASDVQCSRLLKTTASAWKNVK